MVTSLSQEPLTIVGRWIHDNNGASYTFQYDGTVEIELPKLAPYTASYVLDEEAGVLEIQLIIDSQIQRQESAYSLSKDTLTLTNPETGSVVTVSYTHLDVYKRQAQRTAYHGVPHGACMAM